MKISMNLVYKNTIFIVLYFYCSDKNSTKIKSQQPTGKDIYSNDCLVSLII